jgi:topoisomerase-4 subunit A
MTVSTKKVPEMFKDYYTDYASYVILERAVPKIDDGLKPVQRRILHALFEMDDSRLNKVANVVGHAMRYHPHGDASISDALVTLAQRSNLIDKQGNWGNVYTGDNAAAARYIEARLSTFAKEVLFNTDLTPWTASYDGRGKEPVSLPSKFPLLLLMGTEGIAVGLATKILPHNFNEILDSCVAVLKGKDFTLVPDFPHGGQIDVSDYQNGARGGKVKVRAKINIENSKTLKITEIPFGTTTSAVIDSIVAANDKGKIKIKKIEDNTSKDVEILIHLHSDMDAEKAVQALYAFTSCEVQISPNCCVIQDGRPIFTDVKNLLIDSAKRTKALLQRELEIKRQELQEKIFFGSLERIFIENRIYRKLEECSSWEDVVSNTLAAFKPFKKDLLRELEQSDIERLVEIKIKRITKYDAKKADEIMKGHSAELSTVESNLKDINNYTIKFFENLKKKYGQGQERRTHVTTMDSVDKASAAVSNVKLYVNRKEGFVGFGPSMKKEELLFDCSDIDDIVCINKAGEMRVIRNNEKSFVFKDIVFVGIFRKNDTKTIYQMVYQDLDTGTSFVKRFNLTAITRDKTVSLAGDSEKAQVFLFNTVSSDSDQQTISVVLKPAPRLRKAEFEIALGDLLVKGKNSKGNVVSKYPLKEVLVK